MVDRERLRHLLNAYLLRQEALHEHLEQKTDPPTSGWWSKYNSMMHSPGVSELAPIFIARERLFGPATVAVMAEVEDARFAPTLRTLGQIRWLAGLVVECVACGGRVAAGETVWDDDGVLRHEGCVEPD